MAISTTLQVLFSPNQWGSAERRKVRLDSQLRQAGVSCYGLSWRDLRRHLSAGIACWTKLETTPATAPAAVSVSPEARASRRSSLVELEFREFDRYRWMGDA